MEKGMIKSFIAKRAAKEFKDGDFVNLGIGLPTMIPAYLPEDVHVSLEAELGMAGAGTKRLRRGRRFLLRGGGRCVY